MNYLKKRLAFIVPTLSNGGAERVVTNLTKGISNDYEKITIIYHDTEKTYDHAGTLINLNIGPADNLYGKLLNSLRRITAIKKIKKEYQIDKSISFLDNPNMVNIFSKTGETVYVSIRNQQSKEFKGLKKIIHKLVVKHVYSRANKIVAISQGVKQDLIENFDIKSEKIEVIYNPIDMNRVNQLKKDPLDSQYKDIFNNPTVITAGRLSYQKGQWHLIRAFKKVVEKVPNAKLIILGTGNLNDNLKKLVEELGLAESVYFLGFQDNPFKYIHRADVFILPSLFEGLGNVILEAMACETPVISTDCKSGPREIIAPSTDLNASAKQASIEEYGVLVPVPDGKMYDSKNPITYEEKVISNAILSLLEDRTLSEKLRKKGLERVNEFSFDNIVGKWLSL